MLCYSTGSLPDALTENPSPAGLASALAHWLLPTPFRGIEFVVRPSHLRLAQDAGFWRALRHALEARGLCVRNVHLGFPRLLSERPHSPGLASLSPSGRALRREAAQAAALIAHSLGSPHVTLTSGQPEIAGGMPLAPHQPMARPMPPFAHGSISPDFLVQWQALRSEVAHLVKTKPASVALLFEPEPEMVLHSAWQLGELCHEFPGEVFANYDVGHGAVLGENLGLSLRALGPYLRNVHLEDIAQRVHRHLLFGSGEIDFAPVFAALQTMGYAGDITPDLYPFCESPDEALAVSSAFLRQWGRA